jgi:hypothetical protein
MLGFAPVASTPIASLLGEDVPDFPVRTICMNAGTRLGFLMRADVRNGFDMQAGTRKGFSMKAKTRGCC